jgi:hypothetical protein
MNASDIVKSKQNGILYKVYYNPSVFQSTVYSTIYPFSSFNGNTSYTSCINTIYNYECNSPIGSYELANDINNGKYICGGKTPSVLAWKAISTLNTEKIYAFPSYSTTISNSLTINSLNSHAPRPLICIDPIVNQGTSFSNNCQTCNNFGAGIDACCHNCASGI